MLKVLIADDEPRVGQLVKHLIHWDELGLSFVDICRDGRTALERIEQEWPEIVITDIRMPVLTGLELVQQVTERFPQTRFVVISGYRYFEYAQKAVMRCKPPRFTAHRWKNTKRITRIAKNCFRGTLWRA